MLIASRLSGMRSMPAQPTTVWSRRSSPPPGLNGGWREARGRASTCVGRCFGLGGEPRGGRGCGGGMGGGGSKAAQMRARAFKCPPLEKTCAAPRELRRRRRLDARSPRVRSAHQLSTHALTGCGRVLALRRSSWATNWTGEGTLWSMARSTASSKSASSEWRFMKRSRSLAC